MLMIVRNLQASNGTRRQTRNPGTASISALAGDQAGECAPHGAAYPARPGATATLPSPRWDRACPDGTARPPGRPAGVLRHVGIRAAARSSWRTGIARQVCLFLAGGGMIATGRSRTPHPACSSAAIVSAVGYHPWHRHQGGGPRTAQPAPSPPAADAPREKPNPPSFRTAS